MTVEYIERVKRHVIQNYITDNIFLHDLFLDPILKSDRKRGSNTRCIEQTGTSKILCL